LKKRLSVSEHDKQPSNIIYGYTKSGKKCVCKNYQMIQHYKNVKHHPLLYEARLKGKVSKDKQLTKYFVVKLLSKLEYRHDIIEKCTKVPMKTFAKIMDLCVEIIKEENNLYDLQILDDWLCKDFSTISKKLDDPKLYHDTEGYLKRHVRINK